MSKKNYILITAVIGLLTLCLSCWMPTEAQKNTEKASDQSVQNITQSPPSSDGSMAADEIDTSKWKTYKDTKNGFSFRYPPDLILQKKKGGRVRLYHSVRFRHQEPCGYEENSPFLENLIDFDITIKISPKNFQSYKWEEYDRDAEIKLGRANDSVQGKIVTHSYDGCGYEEYIYPFKNAESFIIEDQIVSLFSYMHSTLPEAEEAKKHPKLLRNQEGVMKQILESFIYTGK